MAKKTTTTSVKEDPNAAYAYSVKAKAKVKIENPTIVMNKRGGFMAKGQDKDGNNVFAILSKEKAEELIAKKIAKKGF